jgi:hypothetical protein
MGGTDLLGVHCRLQGCDGTENPMEVPSTLEVTRLEAGDQLADLHGSPGDLTQCLLETVDFRGLTVVG